MKTIKRITLKMTALRTDEPGTVPEGRLSNMAWEVNTAVLALGRKYGVRVDWEEAPDDDGLPVGGTCDRCGKGGTYHLGAVAKFGDGKFHTKCFAKEAK